MDEILKIELEIDKKRFQNEEINNSLLGRQDIHEKFH